MKTKILVILLASAIGAILFVAARVPTARERGATPTLAELRDLLEDGLAPVP